MATTLGTGRRTVAAAGTPVQLQGTAILSLWVIITAETDNTRVIVVGGASVEAALATREGTPLGAGDTIALDVVDLSAVWIDSTVNGDGVTYTYGT